MYFCYFGKCTSIQLCYIQILLHLLSVVLLVSKRFGLPDLLQSACKIVIATATNVQTTLASLLPRLTDKRLFMFGAGRYNCAGVSCFFKCFF